MLPSARLGRIHVQADVTQAIPGPSTLGQPSSQVWPQSEPRREHSPDSARGLPSALGDVMPLGLDRREHQVLGNVVSGRDLRWAEIQGGATRTGGAIREWRKTGNEQ